MILFCGIVGAECVDKDCVLFGRMYEQRVYGLGENVKSERSEWWMFLRYSVEGGAKRRRPDALE